MKKYIVIALIVFALVIFVKMPNVSNKPIKWWEQPNWEQPVGSFGNPAYSYWEGFESGSAPKVYNVQPVDSVQLAYHVTESPGSVPVGKRQDESPIMEYPPNTPNHVDLYNNQPYHLLEDEMGPPRQKEALSCVNSRSCYATDFEQSISKTGNFRQLTNNYKREYPDNCTAPSQELVLNFYKV